MILFVDLGPERARDSCYTRALWPYVHLDRHWGDSSDDVLTVRSGRTSAVHPRHEVFHGVLPSDRIDADDQIQTAGVSQPCWNQHKDSDADAVLDPFLCYLQGIDTPCMQRPCVEMTVEAWHLNLNLLLEHSWLRTSYLNDLTMMREEREVVEPLLPDQWHPPKSS